MIYNECCIDSAQNILKKNFKNPDLPNFLDQIWHVLIVPFDHVDLFAYISITYLYYHYLLNIHYQL